MAPTDVEAAVLALFTECHPPLRRYISSLGLHASDAEDLAQDVFVFLFRHLQQGRSRHNLKGWLFTVARNLAWKHRARAKRRRATLEGEFAEAAEPLDAAMSAEDELARHERQQRLLNVLRALPAADRRCLYLRAEGLRYREIADATDMSLGAVAKSLARSIGKMMSVDDASA